MVGKPGNDRTHDAVDVERVVEEELDYLLTHRHGSDDPAHRELVRRSLIGLALSGGGIRSATTNLGMLQALSRMNVLPMVDYISTVSGGGYIGACLSSLLSWNGTSPAPGDPREKAFVFTGTETPRFTTSWPSFPFRAEKLRRGLPVGSEIVGHLRTHGNFLIARWGLFRRETMRSIGNLLSGIVYNVALFLLTVGIVTALYFSGARAIAPAIHSVLGDSVARLVPLEATRQERIRRDTSRIPAVLATDSTITRVRTANCLPDTPGCETTRVTFRPPTIGERVDRNGTVVRQVLSDALAGRTTAGTPFLWAAGIGAGISLVAFGVVLLFRRGPERAPMPSRGESDEDVFERHILLTFAGVSLVIVAGTAYVLRRQWLPELEGPSQIALLFVPFALLASAWITAFLLAALVLPAPGIWGRPTRSLWGAFQSMLIYGSIAALGFGFLPPMIYALADHPGKLGVSALGALGVTRLLTSRNATGKRRFSPPAGLRNLLLALAVAAVVLFLVLFFGALLARRTESARAIFMWTLGATVVFVVLAYWVNHNLLSPHYFYRDRLAETYLRSELPVEGGGLKLFRDAIEMRLTSLHGDAAPGNTMWRNTAPYHLISAAINLAGSRDLTRKDRKSGYWLFSKLFCGSTHTGFRPTAAYRGGETKLARAITISGAAASSGIGQWTFFAQAFATVLFNVRLGYWLENPADPPTVPREAGVFWPGYLWREVTMNTTETSKLVNLSDGGHTGDNIGIYPLLQRRCKVIIACDAERDPVLSFGSLTEVLRHAYIDLGVDVDIDLTMLRLDATTGMSRSHCAIGRIHYSERPDQESYLVYLKNTLTGDEPAPVLNYRQTHPVFPHESTADQFFDDAQFESYRALGVHLAEHTFGRWVTSKWFPGARQHHGAV